MSQESNPCPKCQSPDTYEDGNLRVCSECFNEWTIQANPSNKPTEAPPKFIDTNGVQLNNGDTILTVGDLKMGKETIKSGTKVKNIRLLDDPVDNLDISCKIPGHGSVYLKCSVVKKHSKS